MVGLVISACLLLVGMPSFSVWIQDLQIRSAAESIQSGLSLARSEAIRRNRPVQLTLTNAGGLLEWQVGCVAQADDCPLKIAQRDRNEGGRNTRVATGAVPASDGFGTALGAGVGLPATIAFNGLGELTGVIPNRIEISHAALDSAHRLLILIDSGGMIRLCSPALTRAASLQGCA
jgi:type IV fimbrial biogenesis protein FimT